jgi:HAD superfamily hydrolase (TIGR01450 family)
MDRFHPEYIAPVTEILSVAGFDFPAIAMEPAWAHYLNAYARMPQFPEHYPHVSQHVDGLADVLDGVDLVIFDSYGVLHKGGAAFPEALRAISILKTRNIPYVVLTNDVSNPETGVAAKLQTKGVDIAADRIVSGRSVLADVLCNYGDGAGFGLISPDPETFAHAYPDLKHVALDQRACDQFVGFVLVNVHGYALDVFARIAESLSRIPRPVIVCNPDITCPFHNIYTIEPGLIAHQWADVCGIHPIFIGKPYPQVYNRVMDIYAHVPPDRMLMVGDSPHTDILGGAASGMQTLLVQTGLLHGRDVLPYCAEAGIFPNFLAAHL